MLNVFTPTLNELQLIHLHGANKGHTRWWHTSKDIRVIFI